MLRLQNPPLQFFTQVSTTMSTGIVQQLQGHALHISSDVNNHNRFFGTDSTVNFKVTVS